MRTLQCSDIEHVMKRMLVRTIGVLIPRTQKNFPKEVFFFYVPGGIRTPDRRLRRALLYPAELLRHEFFQAKLILSYAYRNIKHFILNYFSYMIFGGSNVFFIIFKVMLEYQENSKNRSTIVLIYTSIYVDSDWRFRI